MQFVDVISIFDLRLLVYSLLVALNLCIFYLLKLLTTATEGPSAYENLILDKKVIRTTLH